MMSTPKSCPCIGHAGFIICRDPLKDVSGSACIPMSETANVAPEVNGETIKTRPKTQKNKKNTSNEIGIIQTNLHKSKAATSLLSQNLNMNENNLHIALLTEPHTFNGKIPNIEGKQFHTIYPTSVEGVRACIIIKNTLQYLEIPELQSRDTTAILVDTSTVTGKKYTIFASIYLPPEYDNQPPTQGMRRIIQYATNNDIPLIIGSDTNGHHQMWGSTNNNKRGNNLAEYILTVNLQSINTGNNPTFISANGQTIIDVTFASTNIVNKIKNWHVSDDVTLSDHKYIKYTVTSEREEMIHHHNPRKTNWDKFRVNLKRTLPETQTYPHSIVSLEEDISNLTNALNKAFTKATKTQNNKNVKRNNSIWWTAELTTIKRNANIAYRRYKNNKCSETWQNWKYDESVLATTIQREKRRGWRKYTTNIETLQEGQRLTKILGQGPTKRIGLLKRPDGTSTKTTEDTLKHLLDTHFPGNIEINNEQNTHDNTKHHITTREWIEAGKIITESKIKWAINEFQPYKSPGSDGIYPIMLQKSNDIIEENLYNILRACIAYGYIPKEWRVSKAIFLPKPCKNNYDDAKAFRPISLTSFMLKTMEKILDRELRDTTLTDHPIHKNQHAYQTGKSTETALHALTTKISVAIDNKEYALCTFFDIAGAFDNAKSHTILRSLRARNANQQIITWIANLLHTRIVTTSKGNTSITAKATRGCPQGGVLSPLLWCLVVDELLTKLNNLHIYMQAYSDDGTIIITGKNLQQICSKTQGGINIAVKWCKENDLQIHPNKTNMVLFTKIRKTTGWTSPTIENVPIPLQPSFKYLGVTLDPKLTYKQHIQTKGESTVRTFFQVRQAMAGNWGLSPKIMKWLYITVIRPRITYAAIIWWERSTLTHTKAALQKIQRLATISITGAMKTTPNIALDSISGLTPLFIHICAEAMKSYIRMKSNNSWIAGAAIGHRFIEVVTKQSIEIKDIAENTDSIKKTFRFTKHYSTKDDDETTENNTVDTTCHIESTKTKENDIRSRVYIEEINYTRNFLIRNRGTKAQGELIALKSICKELITRKTAKNIHIIFEHKDTINSLLMVNTKSKIIVESIDQLNQLSNRKHVTIQMRSTKTPYPANTINTQELETQSTRNLGLSYKEIMGQIDEWAKQNHKNLFKAFPGGRQTKENIADPYDPKLKNICERKRKDIRMITHILTGHTWLNKHMHTIKISSTPLCQICQTEDETVEHFIYNCPELTEERKLIFGTHNITPRTHPIIGMDHNQILAYCKATHRLDEPDEG
jgi:hypothetical protein